MSKAPLHLRNPRFIHRRRDLHKERRSRDRNVIISIILIPFCCAQLAFIIALIATNIAHIF